MMMQIFLAFVRTLSLLVYEYIHVFLLFACFVAVRWMLGVFVGVGMVRVMEEGSGYSGYGVEMEM